MTTQWGGWLPHNRRVLLEPVSLVEAASRHSPLNEGLFDYNTRPTYGHRRCANCDESFPPSTAPNGYPAFCTQVCIDQYRRAVARGDR